MINVFCYYFGMGGWHRHSQNFLEALNGYQEIALFPWDKRKNCDALPAVAPSMLARAKGPLQQNIALGIGPVERMTTLKGRKKIAYVVWDTTRIPYDKRKILKSVDQIWIPSEWVKSVLMDNAFDSEMIRVVPEGVDCSVFRTVNTMPSELRPYRFLCVGKWEQRKGIIDLINTYAATFREDEPVELILQCFDPYTPGFNLGRAFQAVRPSRHPSILLGEPMSQNDLVKLYNSCDAFVLPTKAESWGLPIIEAMACALPVIVTEYSGHKDYVTSDCGYFIRVKRMIPVKDSTFFRRGAEYGYWAQPDLEHLSFLLRYVFEHRDEARDKGLRACEHVTQHWTWDHAARMAHQRLQSWE